MAEQCKEELYQRDGSWTRKVRCSLKAGPSGYCHHHAPSDAKVAGLLYCAWLEHNGGLTEATADIKKLTAGHAMMAERTRQTNYQVKIALSNGLADFSESWRIHIVDESTYNAIPLSVSEGAKVYIRAHWTWRPLQNCAFRRWVDGLADKFHESSWEEVRVVMGFDS